jgi:predicted MFS family arabinose efflux permease
MRVGLRFPLLHSLSAGQRGAATQPPDQRTRSSVRVALAHRDFRVIWAGSFGTNIGRWMQTMVLGAFAYDVTGSPAYVGYITFAQLGPVLLVTLPAGVLADTRNRKSVIVVAQAGQAAATLLLAGLVAAGDPNRHVLLLAVFLTGTFYALYSPALAAVLPELVPQSALPGAISLNSMQQNLSRAVGPALNVVAYPALGTAGVLFINVGLTAVVVVAVLAVEFPSIAKPADRPRVLDGVRLVLSTPFYRRLMASMVVFSFFCLPFIGLMPVVAEDIVGIAPLSVGYWVFYSTFAVGAVVGSLLTGTLLEHRSRLRVGAMSLLAFAGMQACLSVRPPAWVSFIAVAGLGLSYMSFMTSMVTRLQEVLMPTTRGQVLAVWMVVVPGTVPVANLVAGPFIEVTSASAMLVVGALVAIALSWWLLRSAPLFASTAVAP